MDLSPTLLLLVVPLVLVQLGLLVLAVWDLTRPGRRVRGGSKAIWLVVVVLVSVFGPLLYFLVGREDAVAVEAPPPPPGPGAIPGWTPPDAAMASVAAATGSAPAAAPVRAAPAAVAWSAEPGAVTTSGLTKRYGDGGVLALDRLDLEVPAGSVFGLLGPNGAGKTTTLRLVTGLIRPTAGTARVAGVPIEAGGAAIAPHIGFLDQDPRSYGWLTGRETVALAGRLHGLRDRALEGRVAETLALVGLLDAADRRVATYSGGMRQRLGIAQALVNRPPVVILDEPVSSLDPEGRRDLLELIAGLRGTTTTIFSTHVLADVERVCDRVAILDRGRLVTEGPLDELLDRYALPVFRLDPEPGQADAVARLVAALEVAPWATEVAVEHGLVRIAVTDPARASAELLPTVVAAGVRLAGFERSRPTLEDVFLLLVGRDRGTGAAA